MIASTSFTPGKYRACALPNGIIFIRDTYENAAVCKLYNIFTFTFTFTTFRGAIHQKDTMALTIKYKSTHKKPENKRTVNDENKWVFNIDLNPRMRLRKNSTVVLFSETVCAFQLMIPGFFFLIICCQIHKGAVIIVCITTSPQGELKS